MKKYQHETLKNMISFAIAILIIMLFILTGCTTYNITVNNYKEEKPKVVQFQQHFNDSIGSLTMPNLKSITLANKHILIPDIYSGSEGKLLSIKRQLDSSDAEYIKVINDLVNIEEKKK